MTARVSEGLLSKGSIIAAKFTYDSEILGYKFYSVEGYTAKRVKVQEIECITTYDDGLEGPHYFNAPQHCQPLYRDKKPVKIGPVKAVTYNLIGDTMITKPCPYYTSRGKWGGKPLEVYNLH